MSLINQSSKDYYSSIISNDLHNTFTSDIVVWKKAELTVISTPEDFNFIVGGYQKENIENVPVSETFKAIVQYLKPQEIQVFLEGQGRLDERFNESKVMVRIKCKEDCYLALKGSERIQFDNRFFKISSGGRMHGLFSRDRFTLLLEETN